MSETSLSSRRQALTTMALGVAGLGSTPFTQERQDPPAVDWKLLEKLATEAESRVPVTLRPRVVDGRTRKLTVAPSANIAFPGGTVTVLVGRRESDRFRELTAAVQDDAPKAISIVADAKARIAARTPITTAQAVDQLKAENFLELRYGAKTLASYVFVPPSEELAILTMPYTGGTLTDSDFQVVEWCGSDGSRPRRPNSPSPTPMLDAIVVKAAPELSLIELEALRLVPRNQRELNIGPTAVCFAITGVTIAATVIAACSFCARDIGAQLTNFRPDELKDLGAASASRLLSLRREHLGKGLR